MNQNGFALILTIVLIGAALALVGTVLFNKYGFVDLRPHQPTPTLNQIVCTQDVKLCPDGTYVSRTGPNCDFAPCPNPESTESADTTDWKTYTNVKRGYKFKYPNEYSVQETEQRVLLEKDVKLVEGGGFAGGDALRDGVINSFIIFPNKVLSDAELKSEFGSDITITNILIDRENAIEILFPPHTYPGRNIFYKYADGTVLNISSYAGFEVNSTKKQEYLNTFNQILSTFKFLP